MQYTKLDDQTMTVKNDEGETLFNVSISGLTTRLDTVKFEKIDSQNKIIELQSVLEELEKTNEEVLEMISHARNCGFII